MAASDRDRWNRRYRERGPDAFGTAPSEWLVAHRALLAQQPRGRALDVACGTGRNALYLARLGFTVDALDVSDVAIDFLRAEVERRGLAIAPRRCDLEVELLPAGRYEVVLDFSYLDRALFPQLRQSLRPGGLLIFETFTREQTRLPRGPSDPQRTLEPGELRRAFAELEILDYRETTLNADDPEKARAVASLVARCPDPAPPAPAPRSPPTSTTTWTPKEPRC